MIHNLLAITCVSLLLVGGIFTEHKNTECERDHLTTIKVHELDCAHNDYACLECEDYVKSNISKTTMRRVSVGKKHVFRSKTTYKYFSPINKYFNHQLSYTLSTEPPGNLVIHSILASVIILI